MKKVILVINCGSSSVKSSIYEMPNEKLLCSAIVEKVDKDEVATYTFKLPNENGVLIKAAEDVKMHPNTSHLEAIKKIVELITSDEYGVIKNKSEISAIGHRVVQGGERFNQSMVIDRKVTAGIRALIPLAPLHNQAHLTGIKVCKQIFKNIPQVAVFDNAFHSTMPETSYIFPLPYEYYKKNKIRRYGAHGTSHKYVAEITAKFMNKPIEDIKLITCHLGNGSSITAIKNGKVLDTSMGLTPLDGLMMGTRCGGVDPSAVTYIMEKHGISAIKMNEIMNSKSGLLGISGISSDYKELDFAVNNGNERAKLARDIFWYEIRKIIGSYIAAMDGVDAITFTGGIGENAAELRENVLTNLSYLGFKINRSANKERGKAIEITEPNCPVKAFVIPTNEELAIAKDTFNLTK